MFRSESRLIADQKQRSLGFGIELLHGSNPRVNRRSDPLLPVRIGNKMDMAQIHVGGNDFMMRTQYSKNGIGSGFTDDANRSSQKRFTRNTNQLLGLAEPAAGSGSENDCRHWHGVQFRTRRKIGLDLRGVKAGD